MLDIVTAVIFAAMTALNARNYKVAKETDRPKIEKASAAMAVLGAVGTVVFTIRAVTP